MVGFLGFAAVVAAVLTFPSEAAVAGPASITAPLLRAQAQHQQRTAALPSAIDEAKQTASHKSYSGHLKTKAVNGSLVCETPECSMAAAMILSSMDVTVDPCDDFFMFSCGNFITSHEPNAGTFGQASDLLDKRIQLLLSTPAFTDDPEPLFMIRRAYDACVDTDFMDSLGLAPLWDAMLVSGGMPMVDDQWDPSSFTVEGSLASLRDLNFGPMIAFEISPDFVNTSRKLIYIGEGTTAISEDVLANPNLYPVIMAAYKTFILESVQLLRDFLNSPITDQQLEADVDALIDFEEKLGTLMVDSGARNESEVLELITIKDLQSEADNPTAGQFDYLVYLQEVFAETDVVITPDELIYHYGGPTYVSNLAGLLNDTDPRIVANYMGWMWIIIMGPETTYAMRNISDAFILVYSGSTPMDRISYCSNGINNNLGYPVSRAYIDEFFPLLAKAENEEMVANLRSAFSVLITDNPWLAPEDKVTAQEKLDYIQEFVAYPDWIMNDTLLTSAYEGLVIDQSEQLANMVRLGQYFEYWDCETYRMEPRSRFVVPPTVVNAFYSPIANSITILAGILQIPFYQHNSLAALNYGGIGMVIGHELTHGFDNTGRNFDKDGNLALWWSQESIDAFNEGAQCFVDQYDGYHPPEVEDPTVHVNGQQTLGENIADNGGVREAFQAYQLYVQTYGEEPKLPGLDEFTPEQLFYLGNANVWCESRTESSILSQLASDPHSPGRFRILGPDSNDDQFSRVWNCPVAAPMNRGNDSCRLW